jgi:hypothetical protein
MHKRKALKLSLPLLKTARVPTAIQFLMTQRRAEEAVAAALVIFSASLLKTLINSNVTSIVFWLCTMSSFQQGS